MIKFMYCFSPLVFGNDQIYGFFFLRLGGYMDQSLRISWRVSKCTVEDGDQFTACPYGLHLKDQHLSTCLIGCTKFYDGPLDLLRFSWVGSVPCGMDLVEAASKTCIYKHNCLPIYISPSCGILLTACYMPSNTKVHHTNGNSFHWPFIFNLSIS